MTRNVVFYCFLFLQLVLGITTISAVIHWDEAKLVDAVIHQYNQGSVLAEWYNYPSLIFDLTYIDYFFWDHLLRDAVPDFNIFNRFIFFTVSQLPALVAFYSFRKKENSLLGLFIALVFWSSWEYHYHSRWVAPDTIAASLGFASLLLAYRKKLVVSAILAGLAFGTKYTAGIFLLPLLIIFFENTFTRTLKNWLVIVLFFLSVFLITSPGIVVNYSKAISDIRWEQHHYATGHNNYTVPDFFQHIFKNMYYLVFVIGSKSRIISLLVTLGCCISFVYALKKRNYKAIAIGSVFLLYVIYLSTQKVMFVRNLMLLWPVLSLAAALPVVKLIKDPLKKSQVITTCLILVLPVTWIIRQDLTIIQRRSADQVSELYSYAQDHPGKYHTSDHIREELVRAGLQLPEALPGEYYVFYLKEAVQWELPANAPGWYEKDFGMQESNLGYYSTTQNNDRIIIVNDPSILTNAGVGFK